MREFTIGTCDWWTKYKFAEGNFNQLINGKHTYCIQNALKF